MSPSEQQVSLVDAAVLTSARLSKKRVVFYLTNKSDAEWLYAQYLPLATERDIQKTGEMHVGREHYIDLKESDEHTLSDDEPYAWNEEPVWMFVFTPNDTFLQRATQWYENQRIARIPDDFEVDSTVAEVIYRTRVHEMHGEGGNPILEFELNSLDKLTYYFSEAGMEPVVVNGLFRLNPEDSAILRTLAGFDAPKTEVQDDARDSSE